MSKERYLISFDPDLTEGYWNTDSQRALLHKLKTMRAFGHNSMTSASMPRISRGEVQNLADNGLISTGNLSDLFNNRIGSIRITGAGMVQARKRNNV